MVRKSLDYHYIPPRRGVPELIAMHADYPMDIDAPTIPTHRDIPIQGETMDSTQKTAKYNLLVEDMVRGADPAELEEMERMLDEWIAKHPPPEETEERDRTKQRVLDETKDLYLNEKGQRVIDQPESIGVPQLNAIKAGNKMVYYPVVDLPAKGNNLDKLLTLLKTRLQSEGLLKQIDSTGNVQYIKTDVFSDEALISFLTLSLSEFNATPTPTHFTFEDDAFINSFAEVLIEGATVQALTSMSLVEKGKEFEFVDQDAGVLTKSPLFADLMQAQFDTLIKYHNEKLNRIKTSLKITDQTGKNLGRHRYITQRDHGKFKAGTECWAERIDAETVLFEYDDGTQIQMKGNWFLLGSDMPPRFMPRKPNERRELYLEEEVIKEANSTPTFWMLAGAVLGGLMAAGMKGASNTNARVQEVEDELIEGEGESNDRQDSAEA
jgi:hypothetical protein